MKGGKQLRRVKVGFDSTGNFDVRDVDIALCEHHVRPEDIVSVCMYDGKGHVYYLSKI